MRRSQNNTARSIRHSRLTIFADVPTAGQSFSIGSDYVKAAERSIGVRPIGRMSGSIGKMEVECNTVN